MSGNRLDIINECLKLDCDEEASEHLDMIFWTRKITKGFNESIAAEFNPSWLAWIDESIVSFHNDHGPGWTHLDIKPHPLVNEHHAMS